MIDQNFFERINLNIHCVYLTFKFKFMELTEAQDD